MPDQPCSVPLSQPARATLLDFLEAYLESLRASTADAQAERAKQLAQSCLATDIDILAFVTTLQILMIATPLVASMLAGERSSRQTAAEIVDLAEAARAADRVRGISTFTPPLPRG